MLSCFKYSRLNVVTFQEVKFKMMYNIYVVVYYNTNNNQVYSRTVVFFKKNKYISVSFSAYHDDVMYIYI